MPELRVDITVTTMPPAQPDLSLSNNTPWMNEAIIALVALLMMFAVPAIGWWFKRRQRGKAVRSQIGLSDVKASSRPLRYTI